MQKHQVDDAGKAVVYLVDCTLATVCTLAMKKSKSKYEFRRQIMIAQTGINWMKAFNLDGATTRAHEVLTKFDGDVARWAEFYHVKG